MPGVPYSAEISSESDANVRVVLVFEDQSKELFFSSRIEADIFIAKVMNVDHLATMTRDYYFWADDDVQSNCKRWTRGIKCYNKVNYD